MKNLKKMFYSGNFCKKQLSVIIVRKWLIFFTVCFAIICPKCCQKNSEYVWLQSNCNPNFFRKIFDQKFCQNFTRQYWSFYFTRKYWSFFMRFFYNNSTRKLYYRELFFGKIFQTRPFFSFLIQFFYHLFLKNFLTKCKCW